MQSPGKLGVDRWHRAGLIADESRRLIQGRVGDRTTDGSGGWSKVKPEDL
jgi:hypothetical protein